MNNLGENRLSSTQQIKEAIASLNLFPASTYIVSILQVPNAMPMHSALDAVPYTLAECTETAPTVLLKAYPPSPFINLQATDAASRRAGDIGIGPRYLGGNINLRMFAYEMLPTSEWRVAVRNDFDNPAFRSECLNVKRAWHNSGMLAASQSPFEAISTYLGVLDTLGQSFEQLRQERIVSFALPALRGVVARIKAAFAASSTDMTPIHGESTLSNVMVGKNGAVKLVDFDHAVNADPFYDLGAFCLEFCDFDDEIDQAIEMYYGAYDIGLASRVKLYMVVDDFLWGCWALISHCCSARDAGVEFYKYAQYRFLRCQYSVNRWDIKSLIQRM